jgi:hypothetical protein
MDDDVAGEDDDGRRGERELFIVSIGRFLLEKLCIMYYVTIF